MPNEKHKLPLAAIIFSFGIEILGGRSMPSEESDRTLSAEISIGPPLLKALIKSGTRLIVTTLLTKACLESPLGTAQL